MSAGRRYENGSNGYCFCSKCDYHMIHRKGTPCQKERCPQCGTKMILKMSAHKITDKRTKRK